MKNIPKLRFPEFKDTEPWEQRKSSDIFYSVSDKNHVDLPVLSASQEFGMVKRDEIGIDIKYDRDSVKNYKRVNPGQFVIHLRSFQGGFAHSEIEGITSPAYTILDFSEENRHCDLFWKEIFTSNNFIKRLETVTYGIRDGRSISYADFSSLKFQFPTLPEQERIGSFFQTLDATIASHQRKLEHLKMRKKGLLQKMFPKNGESFPEIRFPEFTDAWEQRRLGEVAEINPKSILPEEFEYVDLGSVIGTEMLSHKHETKNTAPSRAQRLAKKGDVFYQTVRPYQKNNFLFEQNEQNYVFSTGYAQLRPNGDSRFLLSYLQTQKFVNTVLDNCTGTSYPAINSSDLSIITIPLPSLPEQERIGSFFQTLDATIASHQRKLEHLKTLKKGLLQQLFP
ncbi:restriction endonuclease subunit S [Streptococcus panodentis]|nr:restriction endonuclease subunit S [Streptococcus panodentis]